jgi:hypothetical protein
MSEDPAPDDSAKSTCAVTEAPQYGLRALLLAVTAVAISLALMRWLGIFGAACVFGLAVILSATATTWWYRREVRLAFDLTWGMVVPLICLAYDPGIFRENGTGPDLTGPPAFNPSAWTPETVFIYAALGYQMLILAFWIGWGHLIRRGGGVVAGALWVGFIIAILIGLILFLPAFLGLIIGIGAMGFTPWLTALVFYRRAREAQAAGEAAKRGKRLYMARLAGAATAVIVPELTVWLVHGTSGVGQLVRILW